MGKIIIDLGPKEFAPGLAYTAISRAKKLDDIAFDPVPELGRITSLQNGASVAQRKAEDKRLGIMETTTLNNLPEEMDQF